MKIVEIPGCTLVVRDEDRSPMELYGGYERKQEDTASELSRNGKTVHLVRIAPGDGRPWYLRIATYRDGKLTRDYDRICQIGFVDEFDPASYEALADWTVFQSDTGAVFREIERNEASDLAARGYGALCRTSHRDGKVLLSFIPTADYNGETRFWRQILAPASRQYDWKRDYIRTHGVPKES